MEMVRVPLVLPNLEINHNYIGDLRFVGYGLYAVVAITAISCMVWTCAKHRHVPVLAVSPPMYLIFMCCGVLITATTIIPLSYDDDSNPHTSPQMCNIMCMAVPWLASMGFTIIFAALFAKARWINKRFRNESAYRRRRRRRQRQQRQIRSPQQQHHQEQEQPRASSSTTRRRRRTSILSWIKGTTTTTTGSGDNDDDDDDNNNNRMCCMTEDLYDVALPVLLLLVANLITLTCWTILAPLHYERRPLPGRDGWNRVIATYGACHTSAITYPYWIALGVINVTAVCIANWQAWEAAAVSRGIGASAAATAHSSSAAAAARISSSSSSSSSSALVMMVVVESRYIVIAMAIILQAIVGGVPVVILVRKNPQVYYLVLSIMLFGICMSILLLMFIPKLSYATWRGGSGGSSMWLLSFLRRDRPLNPAMVDPDDDDDVRRQHRHHGIFSQQQQQRQNPSSMMTTTMMTMFKSNYNKNDNNNLSIYSVESMDGSMQPASCCSGSYRQRRQEASLHASEFSSVVELDEDDDGDDDDGGDDDDASDNNVTTTAAANHVDDENDDDDDDDEFEEEEEKIITILNYSMNNAPETSSQSSSHSKNNDNEEDGG